MSAPDPGGRFASNDHRRVLGHLGLPGNGVAWSTSELWARIAPDVGSDLNPDTLEAVLTELRTERLAVVGRDTAWRMTRKGLECLCAPAVEVVKGAGPAAIDKGAQS